MNLFMELRKCCNHPYLVKGVEERVESGVDGMKLDEAAAASMKDPRELADARWSLNLTHASAKMVLLSKLLPKLKSQGSKVLIFSQMVRVLDLLQSFMELHGYRSERIDGAVKASDRQAAIDRCVLAVWCRCPCLCSWVLTNLCVCARNRFSDPASEAFVFMLSTRAGGVGINLTAADTVIIFDCDWNPQNDLQAQARCHRIGQTKPVQVYRLITDRTYEMEMFERASLKLGLDQVVLHGASMKQGANAKRSAPSAEELEALLRRGAFDLMATNDGDGSDAAGGDKVAGAGDDIDTILDRAKKVAISGGSGGINSNFSKATFVTQGWCAPRAQLSWLVRTPLGMYIDSSCAACVRLHQAILWTSTTPIFGRSTAPCLASRRSSRQLWGSACGSA